MLKVIRELEQIKKKMEALSYDKGGLTTLRSNIQTAVDLLISYQPKLVYSQDFSALKTNPNKYIDPYLYNKSFSPAYMEDKITRSRKYAIEDIDKCIGTLKIY